MCRDLKSEIIIITPKNQIKLIHFWISKIFNEEGNLASTDAGISNHMSPELVQRNLYSFANDIWSLGIIVYELISFRPHIDNENPLEKI